MAATKLRQYRKSRLNPRVFSRFVRNLCNSGLEIDKIGQRVFLWNAQAFLRSIRAELRLPGVITVEGPEDISLKTDFFWVQVSGCHFWNPKPALLYKPLSNRNDAGGVLRWWPYQDLYRWPNDFLVELTQIAERFYVYRKDGKNKKYVAVYRRDQVNSKFHTMACDEVVADVNDLFVRRIL